MVRDRDLEIPLTNRTTGYVLIELMVVVAIIALVSTVIISHGTGWVDSIRLRRTAREMASLLRLLQNRAMAEERTFRLRFVLHENTRWGYLIQESNDSGMLEESGTYHPFPPGIKLAHFSAFPKELLLYPTGAPSQGATIRLANRRGQSINLTIVPATGRIKVK